MALIGCAAGGVLALLVAVARLWSVLRERTYRRREAAWRHWWRAYCRHLPLILMARWPRGRSISYQRDDAA